MNLDFISSDNGTVVRIKEKKIDSSIAPTLKTEFLKLLGDGHNKILVNLEQVKYMDSSGIGALLFGQRQMQSAEGSLKLANVSDQVMSMIKIAMLDRVFEIFDSEEEGLNSFL